MRNYEHVMSRGEILLPDLKSAKAAWGLHQPEYLDQHDLHFLREGHTLFPSHDTVYQLTEASEPIGELQGRPYGGGTIVVEAQDCSGGYHEAGVNETMVTWK